MGSGLISFLRKSLLNDEAITSPVSPLTPLPVTLSATGNNLLTFRLASAAASNNATLLLVGPGSVFSVSGRIAAGTVYLKFFDKATLPNPAVDVPAYVFPLVNTQPVFNFNIPTQGLFFANGIGLALVTGAADLNNTPVAAGQVTALQVGFQSGL